MICNKLYLVPTLLGAIVVESYIITSQSIVTFSQTFMSFPKPT